MAWPGWLELDGNEVFNVSRVEAYAARFPGFRPLYRNDTLALMLGHGERYTTPLQDDAPWVDPDIPASLDFWGAYPLDIDGLENSTSTADVTESIGDGAVLGRPRRTSKTVVVNALLLARTGAGIDYGFRWLKQVLTGNGCIPGPYTGCGGARLCFFASEPQMIVDEAQGMAADLWGGDAQDLEVTELDGGDLDTDPLYDFDGGGIDDPPEYVTSPQWPFLFTPTLDDPPEFCLDDYRRSFGKVGVTVSPTVTAKRTVRGHHLWTITFTVVAGDPYELGAEVPVLEGFLDPKVQVPWVGGVEPEGGAVDLNGYIHPDADCTPIEYLPAVDPLCPAFIPPAGPPSVPLGCFEPPKNWRRRQITIPKQYVPLWGEVVPKLSIHARANEVRNLRVRFYADPFKVGDIADDPCAFCGDFVVSYVPDSTTMVIDGAERAVYIVNPGGILQRADSLVFKSDGTPFEWPSLTCGFGYIMTLDLPRTQNPPVVDLSLFSRTG